jgi:hypothetical protein
MPPARGGATARHPSLAAAGIEHSTVEGPWPLAKTQAAAKKLNSLRTISRS